VAYDQLNIEPAFTQSTVPCEGEAGDLFVMTPVVKGDVDGSFQGLASLWFCTKSAENERPTEWKRVQFDTAATCRTPVPNPPQNTPPPHQA
jgi:hypothetical protein